MGSATPFSRGHALGSNPARSVRSANLELPRRRWLAMLRLAPWAPVRAIARAYTETFKNPVCMTSWETSCDYSKQSSKAMRNNLTRLTYKMTRARGGC
jgi:hypothetical protein